MTGTADAMPSKRAQAITGTFDVRNRRDDIDRAEADLLSALEVRQFPEAARFAVRLALEEALVNAFKHGHKNLPADTPVKFTYSVSEQGVQLDIVDQGPGFDPAQVPDPTLEENLDKPSGRGLLLMRAYMTAMEHLGRGNHLRLKFNRTQARAG